MLRDMVKDRVRTALDALQASRPDMHPGPVDFEITRPKRPEHGDFSTNAAMVMAAQFRRRGEKIAPRGLAEALVAHLPADGLIARHEVAGPGFINLSIDPRWYRTQCAAIVAHPEAVGRLELGQGRHYQVEFVSANPTGPLHFGGARNAVLGDALARVFEAAGYRVQREFYVNDAGSQFHQFVESLWTACRQRQGLPAQFPEDGYSGAYIHDYAARLEERMGTEPAGLPREEAVGRIWDAARDIVLEDVRSELELIDIRFDRWFREQTLHAGGHVQAAIRHLTEAGAVYEKDGARWFAASRHGSDQDVVLVRSNGAPTYFAADVAYHRDKFVTRGFDRVVNVWSVDHQGHIPRMKALMRALDLDESRLYILLYDLVKLVRDGVEVSMSKRAGNFLTLREVVAEVGSDAVRFLLLTRSPESVLEFDLEKAIAQDQDNPVYFVQYSHARLCSIQARAAAAGIPPVEGRRLEEIMTALLEHPMELELMKTLLELEEEMRRAMARYSPHNLTYYAVRIASRINAFYRDCRVVDANRVELSQARLALCEAARIVLARVLFLLGVTAPVSMQPKGD